MNFRPLKSLATAASLLLAAQVGIALLSLLPTTFWEELVRSVDNDDAAALLTTIVFGVGALIALIGVWIGSIVVFLIWLNRAAWNIRALIPGGGFQFTPGWCVGWWFVPIANLWKPFQAVSEVAKASVAASTRDRSDPYATSWMTAAVPPIVGAWWTAWIVSNVSDRLAISLAANGVNIVANVAQLVAAVLCILVVRQVTDAQHDAHDRMGSDVRFAAGTAHVSG